MLFVIQQVIQQTRQNEHIDTVMPTHDAIKQALAALDVISAQMLILRVVYNAIQAVNVTAC